MIHMSCPDCGWGLFGKAVLRVDSASADLTCPRCKSVTRVSAVKIHDGDPRFNGFVDMRGSEANKYTYNENNDRVSLKEAAGVTKHK